MAWLPSKTMITNKGYLMLSEAQAGSLPLTITRAELGGSFSQTSALPDLLAIPTPVGSPIIGEKVAGVEGTQVKIVFDNSGLVTPFQVCQIGIYAHHPNIDGGVERLYMISQCESPAETIPVGTDNIIRLLYNVYIKHSRANNVVINVNNTYIPIASHSELGGIIVGDGLDIDVNGVLSATGSILYRIIP